MGGIEIVGGVGGKNQSKGLNSDDVVLYFGIEIYGMCLRTEVLQHKGMGWGLIRALRFRKDFFVTFFLGKKVSKTKVMSKIGFTFRHTGC